MSALRAWLLALAVVLAGCASPSSPRRSVYTGDPLADGPAALQQGPPRDRVVWEYRMAAAAMRRGQYENAQRSLDDALPRIGGIIANDKAARQARSLFHSEAKKTFIGEPYERVMAYYYRGILYWMQGEWDNARACFRSAQFQDADVENKTYAADYVLLDYLDGLLSIKLGTDGSDQLKRARANAKNSSPPPYNAKANVIVFIEMGYGPLKYATGAHEEQLRFREGPTRAHSVLLRQGTEQYRLVPYDDLYFQATTRGGRVMDHILANKAVFKDVTGAVGQAGLISGLALAATDNHEAAAIVGGIGVLSTILSAATVPRADTRCWDNLPQYLTFAALQLPPGPRSVAVDFFDAGGRLLTTRNVPFTVPAMGRDTVLFVSELN
jgi:tetratricopeptide (TPR) repeat protein